MRALLWIPDCNWVSYEQQKASICAIQGDTDLLVALSTGSGKSVIPMLAATQLPAKTFVIVVPLISLLED